MSLTTVFFTIFWILSIVHSLGEMLKNPLKTKIRHITKPFLMPLLVAAYLTAASFLVCDLNWLIIVGILLGCVGDIVLMWPKKQICFMIGLVSFLVGHILYVIAFFQAVAPFGDFPWVLILIGALYLVAFVVILKFFAPYLKEMKPAVAVYMIIILVMSFSSIMVMLSPTACPFIQPIWLFIGSLCFIASDFLLANQSFRKPFKYDQVIIMLTYLAAQFFIVFAATAGV
jgi:uncharacterized membrane protein YhhN